MNYSGYACMDCDEVNWPRNIANHFLGNFPTTNNVCINFGTMGASVGRDDNKPLWFEANAV